ncbi:MAG: dienelactone hydrolase family protein [Fermentimonas sp.]|nr:dienelactone hydrolase family protein [Fermentimonas sp.]
MDLKHRLDLKFEGVSLEQAEKALIMLHGRGGTAEDILSLSRHLGLTGFALIAPQATNHTWYPYSFIAPTEENEPWLASAVEVVGKTVEKIMDAGIAAENIYFLGFSQGACLTLEYTARNARRYGGIVAFTGGLIGDEIDPSIYKGDFEQTPVLLSTGDPDAHVPVDRVMASAEIFKGMNASVTEKVYQGKSHSISINEVEHAKKVIFVK